MLNPTRPVSTATRPLTGVCVPVSGVWDAAARLFTVLLVVGFVAGCTGSRQATESPTQTAGSKRSASDSTDDGMKKYSELITDEAVSDSGLFVVHKVDEDYFYEIPDSVLGREMILVSRIARTADNIGYGGEQFGSLVVRWQRHNDSILLRIVSHSNVAPEGDPLELAVQSSNFEPILRSFDVEAINPDSNGVVIDVTGLFSEDVAALGLTKSRRETYEVRRLDDNRSFIESIRSYPTNIEVRSVMTYDANEPPSGSSTNTISLEINHSMVVLPVDKMQPRLCDDRVGFFGLTQTHYASDSQKADEVCYIRRWRLEPKDPEAFARGELVEPVKQIVYYIDPATPEKWRPYLKQGVDDWNAAFETAGFRNAIVARDPPSPEEDPEFSPEDARYSVIRYFSSDIQNAYGPHVADPRTGEILESDIGWYHNVMNLLRNWFFIQTAAINPDARGVAFRDEVMGRLIQFVSAHEVGHTLGLPHNWGSSAAYPVDSLRSPTFTNAMGTAPSIMDYARFNYIAQPEDGDVGLMPDIGPYDKWSVEWGYRPIPDASTPEDETATLNAWVIERADDPVYFYGRTSASRFDPRSQNEDLGDDAVRASELGIMNLKRIVPSLIAWTSDDAEDYESLHELYGQVLTQWNRYMGHVARNIGGVYENPKTYDQNGFVFERVPAEKQRASMEFLQREAFQRPDWMLDTDVLQRIEHGGVVERIRRMQVGVVNMLLDPERITRLTEAEAILGDDAYTAADLFVDVRSAIFSDLSDASIDVFRRNLQRGYVERMEYLLTQEPEMPTSAFQHMSTFTPVSVSQSDVRAYARGELVALRADLGRSASRRHDRITGFHVADLIVRIDDVLEGED
jgi:hypothetical protein